VDRVHVEKHVANLVSTAIANTVSDGAADDCSYHCARVMLAVMDVVETTGRPMIIVFSDESRFCLDSDPAHRLMSKFPKGVMVWGAIGPDTNRR
jgi:hypothetical protein